MPTSVHKAIQSAVLLCIDDNQDVLDCEKAFLETFWVYRSDCTQRQQRTGTGFHPFG